MGLPQNKCVYVAGDPEWERGAQFSEITSGNSESVSWEDQDGNRCRADGYRAEWTILQTQECGSGLTNNGARRESKGGGI